MAELHKCFTKLILNSSCVHFHVQLFTIEPFFLTIKTTVSLPSKILWQGNILNSILQKKERRYKIHTGSLWSSQGSRSSESQFSTLTTKSSTFYSVVFWLFSFQHEWLSYTESLSKEQALRTNTHLRLFAKTNQTSFLSKAWVNTISSRYSKLARSYRTKGT